MGEYTTLPRVNMHELVLPVHDYRIGENLNPTKQNVGSKHTYAVQGFVYALRPSPWKGIRLWFHARPNCVCPSMVSLPRSNQLKPRMCMVKPSPCHSPLKYLKP
uniref:Uncharacterized protein n=1 Tax=Lactuca sativa TaxID=4236 RepID=A0A9R1WGT5_LACSA|nr:hypothetical protein LSAT_V11C200065000 [Lactuca sativa]